MMVDSTFCTVGTANLNSRSLRYDYETNAFIFDPKITNELNANANMVVNTISGSIEATDRQSEKILAASETFEQLNKNMEALASQVEEVNHHILGLSESNNKIMENISQLSAVTEEVTANAEQVHTMSQNNLDCAEQVKTAVEHIRSTTDEMGTQEG